WRVPNYPRGGPSTLSETEAESRIARAVGAPPQRPRRGNPRCCCNSPLEPHQGLVSGGHHRQIWVGFGRSALHLPNLWSARQNRYTGKGIRRPTGATLGARPCLCPRECVVRDPGGNRRPEAALAARTPSGERRGGLRAGRGAQVEEEIEPT